jgi:5-methylcytosine-specific restriction endonuclease McrA
MLEAQNWQCAYCSTSLREVAYELEHQTPLSRGGKTVRDNLCMACSPCNRRKHTKTAEEFQAA